MRWITSYLFAVFVLASCAPVSLYYKEGGSVSRQENDLLSCRVDALDKAPVANQIRRSPPRYIPGRRYCDSKGRCHYSGGYWIGGDVYSVDVNAKLRRQVEAQCMGRKGYQPVELPRCSSGVSAPVATTTAATPASPARSARMPPLTETSCAVKDAYGNWKIIDPAG